MVDSHYIGLIGKNRGGKDTVSELITELVAPKDVSIMGFSDPINECLFSLGLEKSRENQDTFSTANREAFGQELLAHALHARALRSEADFVVLHGIRRPADTVKLRTLPGFLLFYIDAPPKLRYEWMRRANDREGDAEKTWEEFLEDEKAEPQLLIDEIAKQADIVLVNDKDDASVSHLKEQLREIAKKYSWIE